jgi:hypothetical protein
MAKKNSNPDATALRDRWTPEQLERVAQAFRERTLLSPFAPVTIGRAEYQDLRGFTIRHPIREFRALGCHILSVRFYERG